MPVGAISTAVCPPKARKEDEGLVAKGGGVRGRCRWGRSFFFFLHRKIEAGAVSEAEGGGGAKIFYLGTGSLGVSQKEARERRLSNFPENETEKKEENRKKKTEDNRKKTRQKLKRKLKKTETKKIEKNGSDTVPATLLRNPEVPTKKKLSCLLGVRKIRI